MQVFRLSSDFEKYTQYFFAEGIVAQPGLIIVTVPSVQKKITTRQHEMHVPV